MHPTLAKVLRTLPFARSLQRLRQTYFEALRVIRNFRHIEARVCAERISEILPVFQPYTQEGLCLIRAGQKGDGGYVMMDSFEAVEAAYSLGVDDNVSWDDFIVARRIPVYMYDPTVEGPPHNHPLFNFAKVGITGNPNQDVGMRRLCDLMVENGHQNSKNLLLKMDIEGYEWSVFDSLSDNQLNQFTQIICELHGMQEMFTGEGYFLRSKSLMRLSRHFVLVHLHANNVGVRTTKFGVTLHDLLEATFVRKDLLPHAHPVDTLRTDLDHTNDATRAEVDLQGFWAQSLTPDP